VTCSFIDVYIEKYTSLCVGLTCGSFPGPGKFDHHATMNPMREFIHSDDSHTDKMFDDFKDRYNKNYKDQHEHAKRKHAFRQNLRF
jgi:hypothetical protein